MENEIFKTILHHQIGATLFSPAGLLWKTENLPNWKQLSALSHQEPHCKNEVCLLLSFMNVCMIMYVSIYIYITDPHEIHMCFGYHCDLFLGQLHFFLTFKFEHVCKSKFACALANFKITKLLSCNLSWNVLTHVIHTLFADKTQSDDEKTQDIDKYDVFLGDSFVSNDSNDTGTECLCHWRVLSG